MTYLQKRTQTSLPTTAFITTIYLKLINQSSCCMVFKNLEIYTRNEFYATDKIIKFTY